MPSCADPRARPRRRGSASLELLRRDLAQRAEQLRAELVVRVVAQVLLLRLDAGELLLALLEVVERGAVDVGLDRHVRVRGLGDALDHAPVDRARAGCRSPGRAGGRGAGARSRRPGAAGRRPACALAARRAPGGGARAAAARVGAACGARGCRARACAAARRRPGARARPRRAPCGRRRPARARTRAARSGMIWTTGATRVLTSDVPLRSTMSPRGASIRTLRTRFSRAWET